MEILLFCIRRKIFKFNHQFLAVRLVWDVSRPPQVFLVGFVSNFCVVTKKLLENDVEGRSFSRPSSSRLPSKFSYSFIISNYLSTFSAYPNFPLIIIISSIFLFLKVMYSFSSLNLLFWFLASMNISKLRVRICLRSFSFSYLFFSCRDKFFSSSSFLVASSCSWSISFLCLVCLKTIDKWCFV